MEEILTICKGVLAGCRHRLRKSRPSECRAAALLRWPFDCNSASGFASRTLCDAGTAAVLCSRTAALQEAGICEEIE